MRQRAFDVRKKNRSEPFVSKNLFQIVPPSEIIRKLPLLIFIRSASSQNKVHMVNTERSSKQHSNRCYNVQHQIKLFNAAIKSENENRQGKNDLQNAHRKYKLDPTPDEEIIKVK